MKNKVEYLKLIGKGFSSKTLDKLTESAISTLYKKIFNEQVKEIPSGKKYEIGPLGGQLPASAKGYYMKQDPVTKKTIAVPNEEEIKEDVWDSDAFAKDALSTYTGQDVTHDATDMAPDGMDDDSDNDRKMMDEGRKKKKNPWAICTSQLGKEFKTRERHLWSTKQKNKYERCVKDVKQSLKEGKNPVSLFLENQIIKIVEKHIPPRITKQDLVKYLTEDTTTAPAKPKTKPKVDPSEKPKTRPSHPGKNPNPGEKTTPKAKGETKEDTTTAPAKPKTKPKVDPSEKPRTRPSHPGKNPNPGEKTTPKAITPERAKDEVINAIINILEK